MNWESGECETGAFKNKRKENNRILTGNHFEEEERFY
jgi:hypothetical protein